MPATALAIVLLSIRRTAQFLPASAIYIVAAFQTRRSLSQHLFSFATMNFQLADDASNAVRKHVARGGPLHDGWTEVVKVAAATIGTAGA